MTILKHINEIEKHRCRRNNYSVSNI